MATFELLSFLLESADELINKAESTVPNAAIEMLDEAEELLELGSWILSRQKTNVGSNKEAA